LFVCLPRVCVWKKQAGSGALGDIASHSVDLSRYLVGITEGCGTAQNLITERHYSPQRNDGSVDVDDARFLW